MAREIVPRQPMPILSVEERRTSFAEVSLGFSADAAVTEARRCILCKQPRCAQVGCPLHNRIPEWIGLIQQGKFMEAAKLTRETSSMPEICSRVCPQERLCEGSCALGIKQEPVAIGALERFVNDFAREAGDIPLETGAPSGRSVAVVGAGPAGLAAAERLRWWGHEVVIYDALPHPGGLLRYGLPGFKISTEVVEQRWRLLENAGVRFLGGWRMGRDFRLADLVEGLFDAVFVGVGTWKAVEPRIPGLETPGVAQALPFLGPTGRALDVTGAQVVVLGGGDSAMDCARTALRRGAKRAVIAYRRDEANMPGSKKEVKMARAEGVEFQFLVSPLGFTAGSDGKLKAVELQQMELGEPDAEGRRSPKPIPGRTTSLPADLAVLAFGFKPDAAWAAAELGVDLKSDGTIMINEETGATSRPGVFAGGDVTAGADLVCRAVVAGRRAAASIHRYVTLGDWSALTPPQAVRA